MLRRRATASTAIALFLVTDPYTESIVGALLGGPRDRQRLRRLRHDDRAVAYGAGIRGRGSAVLALHAPDGLTASDLGVGT